MGTKPKRIDYNLLLITVDTLRADHLGCYGYKSIKTPNIDRLASEGVLFSRAITPVPITLPSHASIMTGLYPAQHGVRNNGNFSLAGQAVTLAEIMKGYGYQTGACVGSFVLDSVFGLDQGFDYYDDNFNPGKKRASALHNERKAADVNRAALHWLQKNKDNRFFLWLHYYDPHSPYFPPVSFAFDYKDCLYDGEIAYVDYCLGELFDQIEQMGLKDKTVIVFTADHGEGLGEHNELTHAIFIYDSTLRVPLIIKAPALPERGKAVPSMVSTMDIMPTVLEILDLKSVTGLAGKSLMPLINGGKSGEIHTKLLCESLCPELNFGWSRLEGIRTPEWKYISAPVSELYRFDTDQGERKNILQQGGDDHAKWKTALENIKGEYPPAFESLQASKMDPVTEQRLKSLGYIWTQAKADIEGGEAVPDPKDKIHIMNYLDDGMGYLIIGQYDRAIEEFQKIINDDPDNMAAYFHLGWAYEEKGDIGQAEVFFKKVIEIDPGHSDVYNHLGLIQYLRGEWDQALTAFKTSLDLFEYAEVYYNISLVYQKKGMNGDAVKAIKKAIELDPDYAEAWNQLGNLYMESGDIQGAAEQFEKAIDLDPEHVTAHNNLGLIYSRMGQTEDAIKEFHEAARLDPNSAEAHNNLGSLYLGKGLYEQARSELEKALEIRPDYKKAMINSGMLYLRLNDLLKAEGLFKKVIEMDSSFTEAYVQLGYLYMTRKEFDKALSSFQEMMRSHPDDPKSHYYLGKAYQALGQTNKAIESWRRAIELEPDLAGAHLDIGNALFEMGDFQKAEMEWHLALAGRPIDIPTHLVNLGMVYFQSEKYENAVFAWQKACEQKPDDFNLHYNLAVAYLKQGRYADASLELKECMRIQPNSQNAIMLQEKIRQIESTKQDRFP
ncbi:tetratricopeptide repeat protein [bacterium]|nr:tetratricopeptide repeat protein [bacterium]